MHLHIGMHTQIQPIYNIHQNYPLPSFTRYKSREPVIPDGFNFPISPNFPKHSKQYSNSQTTNKYGNELKSIEQKFNKIMLNIYCQKLYAKQFWLQDKRRIQASVVHMFLILKHIVLALIAQGCTCLYQTMKSQKLCLQLGFLETLINQVLQQVKSIQKFMQSQYFQEEAALTSLFFQEFHKFSQKLPSLKREKLSEVPKLMRYICLSNPIQSSKEYNDFDEKLRKKSQTLQMNGRDATRRSTKINDEDDRNSDIVNTKEFIKNRDEIESNQEDFIADTKNKDKNSNHLKLFKFRVNLCRRETAMISKRETVNSIESIDKEISIEKILRNRSSTLSPIPQLMKSQTIAEQRSKLMSIIKDSRTRIHSSNTRLSGKKIKIKISKISYKEEQEIQRKHKAQNRKPASLPVKYRKYSKLINLETGMSKGWLFIRQYLSKKIAERQLKRLLTI